MKVCFDLDGVLVPDCLHIPSVGDARDFYQLTVYMKPIFVPRGEFGLITARDPQVRGTTETWLQQHFANQPAALWHNCPVGQDPSVYKAEILNSNPGIRLYVESDPNIVASLQHSVTTGCQVLHFSKYLSGLFEV